MTDENDFDAPNPYYPQDKRGNHRGGPPGLFGITSFEGNLYIRRKYLKTHRLRPNWIPGFCVYKFLYVWLDLRLADGAKEPFVGWLYWLPFLLHHDRDLVPERRAAYRPRRPRKRSAAKLAPPASL
jgi:hypothetical protein